MEVRGRPLWARKHRDPKPKPGPWTEPTGCVQAQRPFPAAPFAARVEQKCGPAGSPSTTRSRPVWAQRFPSTTPGRTRSDATTSTRCAPRRWDARGDGCNPTAHLPPESTFSRIAGPALHRLAAHWLTLGTGGGCCPTQGIGRPRLPQAWERDSPWLGSGPQLGVLLWACAGKTPTWRVGPVACSDSHAHPDPTNAAQQVRLAAPGFPHQSSTWHKCVGQSFCLLDPGPSLFLHCLSLPQLPFAVRYTVKCFPKNTCPANFCPEAMDIFAKLMQTLLNKKWYGRRVTNWWGLGQKIFVGLCSILVVPLCKTCVKTLFPSLYSSWAPPTSLESPQSKSSGLGPSFGGLISETTTYCWWLKSCTTWDVWNPINNGKTTNLKWYHHLAIHMRCQKIHSFPPRWYGP